MLTRRKLASTRLRTAGRSLEFRLPLSVAMPTSHGNLVVHGLEPLAGGLKRAKYVASESNTRYSSTAPQATARSGPSSHSVTCGMLTGNDDRRERSMKWWRVVGPGVVVGGV